MDTLSRDDLKPHNPFQALAPATQKVLKRAASHGRSTLTPEMVKEIDRDWIMVPSKKGLRQVVCNSTRAFEF